jgi:acetyltransferase-like isoleucine patch superfamily enzyme
MFTQLTQDLRLGKAVFVNYNCTFIDTSPITIGARTLVAPACSFFSGRHPLDPFLRNGTKGPEDGAPITIGEDCWIGGNAIILPGVTIGRGVTVGAGSVVTKDVEDFCVVAGNPARLIRRVEPQAPDPRLNASCDKSGNAVAGPSS